MKLLAAIWLFSWPGAQGVRVAPEIIANVSLLLARHYDVDCVQIFRANELSLPKVEILHRMWKALAAVDSKVTTGMYTYEGYLLRKKSRAKKVSCYRSLKVMSDDEQSKSGYAKFSMKFSIKDAVWVLYSESLAVKFFQEATVVFDDSIIIAVMESEDVILFHEVYRISDDFSLRAPYLGNWTKAKGLQMPEKNMYERRKDLEGAVLRTASVQNWPVSYMRNGRWQGFLVQLWEEIKALINCTSVNIKAENLIGMRLENGSWNGLVGMAMRGEIDVLVAEVVIDKERSHALDFFYPIIKSRFQIYTRHLGYDWQWTSILKPFHVSVWAAAIGWILVATISWTFTHRLSESHGLGSVDFGKFVPLKAFFFVLQALCQQGYHFPPNSYACRVLFFVSYAVSSVLIPSYSASLVSYLSRKVHLKSFDSLQDMVADGSYRLIVKENTAQHAFFVHSKDEFYKKAYDKLVKPVPEKMRKFGVKQSVKALCHLDKYAVMGIEDIVEGRLHHLVSIDCPVVHLTYPVSTIYLTMATPKNNPFWGLINYHLGKLLNAGVADRLKRLEFPIVSVPSGTLNMNESQVDVGMQQVISVFVLIGTFIIVSLFLLLLEIRFVCYMKGRNKAKRKKRTTKSKELLFLDTKNRKRPRVVSFPDFYPN